MTSLILKIIFPLIDFLFVRQAERARAKKELKDIASRWDDITLDSARLRKKWNDLMLQKKENQSK